MNIYTHTFFFLKSSFYTSILTNILFSKTSDRDLKSLYTKTQNQFKKTLTCWVMINYKLPPNTSTISLTACKLSSRAHEMWKKTKNQHIDSNVRTDSKVKKLQAAYKLCLYRFSARFLFSTSLFRYDLQNLHEQNKTTFFPPNRQTWKKILNLLKKVAFSVSHNIDKRSQISVLTGPEYPKCKFPSS